MADANSTGFSVRLQQRNKEVTTYGLFLCSTTAQPWSVSLETGAVGLTSGSAVATVPPAKRRRGTRRLRSLRSAKLSAK